MTRDWRAAAMSEVQLQDAVLACARLLGYRAHHAWLSLHSAAGYPDATLVRMAPYAPRLIFAEFKRERSLPTMEQLCWLTDLGRVAGIEVFLWRPSQWISGEIERILRGEEELA